MGRRPARKHSVRSWQARLCRRAEHRAGVALGPQDSSIDFHPGELVRLKVDVIVAPGEPAIRTPSRATNMIPIVMTVVSDPVAAGFVKSLARPGGNLTGLTNLGGIGLLSDSAAAHGEHSHSARPFS